jgi:hypothetical protein
MRHATSRSKLDYDELDHGAYSPMGIGDRARPPDSGNGDGGAVASPIPANLGRERGSAPSRQSSAGAEQPTLHLVRGRVGSCEAVLAVIARKKKSAQPAAPSVASFGSFGRKCACAGPRPRPGLPSAAC